MINGARDVRSIASELGRSDFEVAKRCSGRERRRDRAVGPGHDEARADHARRDLAELVARAEEALARRRPRAGARRGRAGGGRASARPGRALLLGRIAAPDAGRCVEELRRALRLDPLAVAAHRCSGTARRHRPVRRGGEQWDQWERLAARSETELAQLDEVRRAKAAAQTLAGRGPCLTRSTPVLPARAGPDSLVFLRLGELLRQKGQLDTAHRVALRGSSVTRTPDAHDLTRASSPTSTTTSVRSTSGTWRSASPRPHRSAEGARVPLFQGGDVQQAAAHLEAAQRAAHTIPASPRLWPWPAARDREVGAPTGRRSEGDRGAHGIGADCAGGPALEEARVFAGLEGAQEGLLLLDASGRVLGGALKDPRAGT